MTLQMTIPQPDDVYSDTVVSHDYTELSCFQLLSKRRIRPYCNNFISSIHRRKWNNTVWMSILLLLLPFSQVCMTNATFIAVTVATLQKASSTHMNFHNSGQPQIHHTNQQYCPCTRRNPIVTEPQKSLNPSTTLLLLLLNAETNENVDQTNTVSTTTAAAGTVTMIGNNQQSKSYGDKIYNRVKRLGKILTFQASNPKNSAYFFGTTNNKMQHYYQNVDPSRRIFQMADDVDMENNIIIPNQQSTGSVKEPKPLFSGKNVGKKIKKRQKDEDMSNDNEDTNAVFNNYGGSSVQSFETPVGDERQVWEALASLEKDMSLLDRIIGTKPQLSNLQLLLLGSAVLSTASSPLFLAGQLTEFIAPSMAAFTAAIGIAAEYRGRVAVADSKEVAAASLQCAAEAEGYLAAAERAKAVRVICLAALFLIGWMLGFMTDHTIVRGYWCNRCHIILTGPCIGGQCFCGYYQFATSDRNLLIVSFDCGPI
jgi:hypothetical protein